MAWRKRKEKRIAMVSRIRMLRTPYNGHSNELKLWVQRRSIMTVKGARYIWYRKGFNAGIDVAVTNYR